jgi:hypothetical protein
MQVFDELEDLWEADCLAMSEFGKYRIRDTQVDDSQSSST